MVYMKTAKKVAKKTKKKETKAIKVCSSFKANEWWKLEIGERTDEKAVKKQKADSKKVWAAVRKREKQLDMIVKLLETLVTQITSV